MIGKYIILNGNPILFPNDIIHSEMVNQVIGVESAGFFFILYDQKIQTQKVICMGESTSLSICSRPETDQKIIASFLQLK